MRARLFFVGLGVIATACGGSAGSAPNNSPGGQTATSPAATEATAATTAPPSTEAPDPTEAPAPTEPPTALGPPAPDFTLTLSDGEEFVLSEQSKPVYIVFWAEW